MTIKTTADGDVVATETIADRLRSVQSEPWRTLRYTDENDDAAWDIYNESLFLRPEAEEGNVAEGGESVQAGLDGRVPSFSTTWGDKELLEAVSDIKKPEPEPSAPETEEVQESSKQQPTQPPAEETKKGKGRARGGGTGAARRGGRSRASTSKAAETS